MRKLFILLFKFVIPICIVGYPIANSLHWSLGGYFGAGSALILFVVLWLKLFKKIVKKIEFRHNYQNEQGSITFWTNFNYELVHFIKFGLMFYLLNLLIIYSAEVRTFAIFIMASYFIGAVIKIGGSAEFNRS